MRLSKIAEAIKSNEQEQEANHAILLYGPPKTGKTQFVGTAAEIEAINTIYWFDMENGYQTLLNSGLSDKALAKIELIRIKDTRNNPVAIETMLKAIASKMAVKICEEHGKVNCAECVKNKAPFITFDLAALTHNDLVVFDSGSQLGDSALAAACLGRDVTFKPGFDEYGQAGFWLSDILSVVQQCSTTNFVVITHDMVDTDEINGKKVDKIYPLMGTRQFCRKVAKYFGTVAYFHINMKKHVAGSSSLYKSDTLTGSRINALLEKSNNLSMRDILIAGGVLPDDTKDKPPPAPSSSPVRTSLAHLRKST